MSKLRRNPDFVFRDVVDECVLVPIARQASELNSIFSLSEVGGFIWHRLDGEHDLAALAEAIVARFEVEPEEAEADLRAFLTELEAIGAVVS